MAKKHCCSTEYTQNERFCSHCGGELIDVYSGKIKFQYEVVLNHADVIKKYKITPEQIQIFRNAFGTIILEYDFDKETFISLNNHPMVLKPKPQDPPEPEDAPADTKKGAPRESYLTPKKVLKEQAAIKKKKYFDDVEERQKKGYK